MYNNANPQNFGSDGHVSGHGPIATRLLNWALTRIIHTGALDLMLPDGQLRHFGHGKARVAIRIHDWKTARRIALNPDIALGEAYMDGRLTLTKGGIYDFLELCLINMGPARTGRNVGPWIYRLQQKLRWMVRRFVMYNPIGKAQQNVAHHYDLSDTLYDLFLDGERQYSCAYFETPDATLEEAQLAKMRHIAAKLQLAKGQRILDIGSGWGGLGMALARMADVDVTGLTLSTQQHRYAQGRTRDQGLDDKVRFHLRDYRNQTGRYDRIVSVGMFEHVGAGHYDEYFAKVAELLDDNGVALVHTIGSFGMPTTPHPWIRKYIFPGGYVPSLSEIAPAIEKSGLIMTDIEVLRLHYAETLRAWRMRFLANRDKVAALYDQRFCRMWEFYLAASEAGFRYNGLVVFQIQLAKRVDALPLTRDYLSRAEARLDAKPMTHDTVADQPVKAPVG